MAKTLCKVAGIVLAVVGLVGFAMPTLLGLHLTPVHNLVHLLTAGIALYMGFAATPSAARTFCIAFGAVYLLLGILGFAAPNVVAAVIGHAGHVSGGELLPDNVVHALLGAAFLGVGVTSPQAVPATR
jgi:hypothetical protein